MCEDSIESFHRKIAVFNVQDSLAPKAGDQAQFLTQRGVGVGWREVLNSSQTTTGALSVAFQSARRHIQRHLRSNFGSVGTAGTRRGCKGLVTF